MGLYQGYVYLTGDPGTPQGAEDGAIVEKEDWSLPGAAAPRLEVTNPPFLRADSRASAKPTSWQARATQWSPPSGAQHLILGPRLCLRRHQPRANKLQPAARSTKGMGEIRGFIGRARRPESAKWVAQALIHGFGPI